MKPRYIAHTSGKIPVGPEVYIEVLLRESTAFGNQGPAKAFTWLLEGFPYDIIAYRVIDQD